ncbi:MAG: hypothetical protein QXP48_03145 [Acidilobaceae archaeon]
MSIDSLSFEETGFRSSQHLVEWEEAEMFAFSLYIASKTSSLEEQLKYMDVAARNLDSILELVGGPLYSEAIKLINYPLMDIFEVIEALGWQNLARLFRKSLAAVKGLDELSIEDVALFADMLGWNEGFSNADPKVIGYAVILSITASFNKALNKIANIANIATGSDLQ